MVYRHLRRWVALIAALSLISLAVPVQAEEWRTKGGDSLRSSFVDTHLGLLQGEPWWREAWTEFGQSATQPTVLGDTIYHLAGAYLWRIKLNTEAQIQEAVALGMHEGDPGLGVNVNPQIPNSPVKVSSSTPTYSQRSGIIYFGTAYGYLWAYDTVRHRFGRISLGDCPVVSSPLVLAIDGRDVVIVGDKADRAHCSTGGGSVWAVWGFDQEVAAPTKVAWVNADVGGWVTPSPILGSTPDSVLVGSDGFSSECKGRAIAIKVVPVGTGYSFERDWERAKCGSPAEGRGGFAGNFVSDGTHAYWVDTAGALWAHSLKDGAPRWAHAPEGLPLPAKLGGWDAFTNTEPAIDLVTGRIYVTLRNYRANASIPLRGTERTYQGQTLYEPGAPGALVAINPSDGSIAWHVALTPEGPNPDPLWDYPAVNTAPLVIRSRMAVIVGDAMGKVRAYHLDTGEPTTLFVDKDCIAKDTFNLINETQRPVRSSQASWSQVSGVGVDPALGGKLLLVGVNWFDPGAPASPRGRLTAIKAGEPYNLRWVSAALEPSADPNNQSVTGTITMDLAATDLGTARGGEPALVQWHIADQNGKILREAGEPIALPANLTTGGAAAINSRVAFTADDPAEGFLVGLIDEPTQKLYAQAPKDPTARCHLGLREVSEIRASGQGGLAITWGEADNRYELPYQRVLPLDLEITLSAPSLVVFEPDGHYSVTVRVRNLSRGRVVAPGVKWTLEQSSTSLGNQRIFTRALTIQPGQQYTQTVKVPMGNCSSRSLATVVLNAANSPAETNLANNRAQVLTQIGPCAAQGGPGAGAGGGGGSGGGGRSIIVPPDCIPNPDLTDPRVCTNYDKTLDDW